MSALDYEHASGANYHHNPRFNSISYTPVCQISITQLPCLIGSSIICVCKCVYSLPTFYSHIVYRELQALAPAHHLHRVPLVVIQLVPCIESLRSFTYTQRAKVTHRLGLPACLINALQCPVPCRLAGYTHSDTHSHTPTHAHTFIIPICIKFLLRVYPKSKGKPEADGVRHRLQYFLQMNVIYNGLLILPYFF